MYDPNFLAKDPQDPQFIAKVRNPCTFLSQIRQYANLFTPYPALDMAVSVGLMASTMSLLGPLPQQTIFQQLIQLN